MNKVSNLLSELIPTPGALITKTTVTTVVTVESLATGQAFQVNTKIVNLCIEGANVRIKADGVNPTTAVGILYPPGTYQFSIQYARSASIVAVSGSPTVTLEELAYSFQ